ncbi:hypothetical protein [Metabacillus sp. RGM 3146]|uniref:hypothetical protein n=1 Tax=Metabacillus sp. RGM 3146 TaxID=3401092 RepID=UPI003B9BFF6E
MKSFQDALYNWMTIIVVSDHRPDDAAAKETADLFEAVLREEFQISELSYSKEGYEYIINGRRDEEPFTCKFPEELIEVMINQIKEEPEKFKNYP